MSTRFGLQRHVRNGLKVVLPVAIVFGAAAATDRLGDAKPTVAQAPREEKVVPVEVATAAWRDNRPTITVFGEIIPARTVELRALVSGPVAEVHPGLAVGGRIAKGERILAVDPFPYEGALVEAEAALSEARAKLEEIRARIELETAAVARTEEQLAFAERDLERAERLEGTGALTEQALDTRRMVVSERGQALEQRRHTLSAEGARLKQQEAAIARLEWQRDRAARDLEDTRLVAPFDGVVAEETVEVGRLVSANDMAVRLYEAGALEVRFVLSELSYGRLLAAGEPVVGRKVAVTWRIGDEPIGYAATIERVSPEIEVARGGVGMLARLDVPDGTVAPRPGAFVEVTVPGPLYPDSVRVSGSAVHGEAVYVVVDGRLQERAVRVLARDGDELILAGDLAEGDVVLTSRIVEVGEGLKVKPANRVPRAEPDATAGLPTGGRT